MKKLSCQLPLHHSVKFLYTLANALKYQSADNQHFVSFGTPFGYYLAKQQKYL